jgi:hypothetical protein
MTHEQFLRSVLHIPACTITASLDALGALHDAVTAPLDTVHEAGYNVGYRIGALDAADQLTVALFARHTGHGCTCGAAVADMASHLAQVAQATARATAE